MRLEHWMLLALPVSIYSLVFFSLFIQHQYFLHHEKQTNKVVRELLKKERVIKVKNVRDVPNRIIEGSIHVNKGTKRVPCDIPCYWRGPNANIHIDELDITMSMSMESEGYYQHLQLKNRNTKHALATTRLTSDVPMPYYNWPWTRYINKEPKGSDIWSSNYIQTPHQAFDMVKKSAVFIARNCASKSNREHVVKVLMNYIPVDSPSTCLNNMYMNDTSNKGKMMKSYALYFAFENTIVDDYITEKLWWTFSAGVLPVYLGAPNINEHVPKHSIINVNDFPSLEALGMHLKMVLQNETLYNSYHKWRYQQLPHFFVKKYNFTHVHSQCRVCRWAYAKKYNYGWDHEQQEVIFTSRETNKKANGKIRMVTNNERKRQQNTCEMPKLPSRVTIKKRTVPRNIVQVSQFSHESDMLRMKIKNTMKFTDEYIIIEGDRSFSLEPKDFYLDEIIDELRELVTITRLKINIKSVNKYTWDVQKEMRLSSKSLKSYFPHLDQDSIIVSTDLDEIIKPNILCLIKHYDFTPMPTGVRWRRFVYGFFNEEGLHTNKWGSFGTVDYTPQRIRWGKKKPDEWFFQDGGWHCSWCMTVNDIILKLKHSPYVDLPRIADTPKFMKKDVICNLIKTGRWFFDKNKKKKRLALSKNIPHDAPQYMLQPTC